LFQAGSPVRSLHIIQAQMIGFKSIEPAFTSLQAVIWFSALENYCKKANWKQLLSAKSTEPA